MLHISIIHTILSTFLLRITKNTYQTALKIKNSYYCVIGKYAKMRGSVKIAGFRPRRSDKILPNFVASLTKSVLGNGINPTLLDEICYSSGGHDE